MNNIIFGDEGFGYYEIVVGGVGVVSFKLKMFFGYVYF